MPPDGQIRVLLVGPLPPPYGGIPTYVRDLFQSGIPGVLFRVFNTAFPPQIAPLGRLGSLDRSALRRNGLWVTLKMILWVLWSYPRLAVTILAWHPDIVQAFPASYWSYWRNWFYLLLAKALGARTIFHLLNAIDLFYNRVGYVQRWLLRISFRTCDAYIVQSEGLRSWLELHCPRPCYGFLNGLHLDRVPSEAPLPAEMHALPRPVGVTIGPLGMHKGTPLILSILQKLHAQGFYLGWVFIGMGDVAYYRRQAQELGLQSQVVFTGPVDEETKWAYLLNADFYCLPSDAEGQPISILEAMAAGLPVVATDVGSIKEIVAQGQTGLVVQVGDEASLRAALVQLTCNDALRRAMGVAAKQYVAQQHNIQRLFAQLAEVYRLHCKHS